MQSDLFGQLLAEKGIKQSHDNAERMEPGWTDRAVRAFQAYARRHSHFMTEDVKAWAYHHGLPRPPADGAWGQVARTAAKLGIVRAMGKRKAKSPGQHGKLMTLWASEVNDGSR